MGFSGFAFANLALTPTIIHFEEGERFKDITLINNTNDTKTYEMSWTFFKMNETGTSYQKIDAPLGDIDVSKYVFFTPRRVTIPGSGSQKVRLAFRRPSEIENGEYYAHLLFSPAELPNSDPNKEADQSAAAGVAVRVGYSVPVIVRIGDFEEKGAIGNLKIKRSPNNKLVLDVPVIRPEGDYGLIGHLQVYHIKNGSEELVGEVVNANVFTEISQRIVPVTLSKEVSGGKLKIVLKSGKKRDETVFDEKILPISG